MERNVRLDHLVRELYFEICESYLGLMSIAHWGKEELKEVTGEVV